MSAVTGSERVEATDEEVRQNVQELESLPYEERVKAVLEILRPGRGGGRGA